jgi:hypothetical protein
VIRPEHDRTQRLGPAAPVVFLALRPELNCDVEIAEFGFRPLLFRLDSRLGPFEPAAGSALLGADFKRQLGLLLEEVPQLVELFLRLLECGLDCIGAFAILFAQGAKRLDLLPALVVHLAGERAAAH